MVLFYKNKFSIKDKDTLRKSVIRPISDSTFLDSQVNKNKAVFGVSNTLTYDSNLITKSRRLSDEDLLTFSQADSIVSLIVSTRCNQASAFGIRSRSKYERGIILRDLQSSRIQNRKTPDQVSEEIELKDELARQIYKWVLNCGTSSSLVKNAVFNQSDSYFKHCSLKDFFGAQTRNLLVTGRMATQLIRNEEGRIIMFRPVPVESIYPYRVGCDLSIAKNDVGVPPQVKIDVELYNQIPPHLRPQAWVQRIEGRIVSFFTERDLRIDYLQKQANVGLNSYPLAPLELAINALQLHMSAQQYMNNNLTKGLGSKGFISIKPDVNAGLEDAITPQELEDIRKEIQNYIAGSYANSAVIPIFATSGEVKFTPLNATSKDMEFLNLYNYVIAILCASFQIAPEEVGFNGTGTKTSLGDEGNQSQIVQGQERGLRQVMNIMCSLLTDVVGEVFDQAKESFVIEPIGIGQNTKQKDLEIAKEQLQTDGTFGRIWAESEHPETFPFGGDVPTSPLFHQNVVRFMKFSEVRYYFFKEKDALTNPLYDFLCDPVYQASYFQLQTMGKEALLAQNKTLSENPTQAMGLEVDMDSQEQGLDMSQQEAEQLLDAVNIPKRSEIDSEDITAMMDKIGVKKRGFSKEEVQELFKLNESSGGLANLARELLDHNEKK